MSGERNTDIRLYMISRIVIVTRDKAWIPFPYHYLHCWFQHFVSHEPTMLRCSKTKKMICSFGSLVRNTVDAWIVEKTHIGKHQIWYHYTLNDVCQKLFFLCLKQMVWQLFLHFERPLFSCIMAHVVSLFWISKLTCNFQLWMHHVQHDTKFSFNATVITLSCSYI